MKTDRLKGKTTKGVRVISNDPDQPELRLKLIATVKTLIQISPKEQVYLRIKRGEPWVRKFRVNSTYGEPIEILKVKSSSKYFTVTHKKTGSSDGKGGYILKLTVSPDIPFGVVREKVEISTDISKQFPQVIRIYGKVEGPITYFPDRIASCLAI